MALQRALTVTNIYDKKYRLFDFTDKWFDAFDRPEMSGIWFIWGNSGNGKTSFIIQLIKELTKFDKVLFNSLEEGTGHTLRKSFEKFNMCDVKNKLHVVKDSPEDLIKRLSQKQSARIVIIDSFQYMQMNYKEYISFKIKFPEKLIIFISHADGKAPSGRSAKSVKFDATLKIWVEGYRAFSHGRWIKRIF